MLKLIFTFSFMNFLENDFASKRLLRFQSHLHLSQQLQLRNRKTFYSLRMRQIGQLSSKFSVNCLVEYVWLNIF